MGTLQKDCSVVGLVVRISGFHPDDPGSIPGRRILFVFQRIVREFLKRMNIRGLASAVSLVECWFRVRQMSCANSVCWFPEIRMMSFPRNSIVYKFSRESSRSANPLTNFSKTLRSTTMSVNSSRKAMQCAKDPATLQGRLQCANGPQWFQEIRINVPKSRKKI